MWVQNSTFPLASKKSVLGLADPSNSATYLVVHIVQLFYQLEYTVGNVEDTQILVGHQIQLT